MYTALQKIDTETIRVGAETDGVGAGDVIEVFCRKVARVACGVLSFFPSFAADYFIEESRKFSMNFLVVHKFNTCIASSRLTSFAVCLPMHV